MVPSVPSKVKYPFSITKEAPDYRHFFPDETEMLSMPHPPKGVLGVTPGIIGCAEAAEVLKIIGEYGEVLSGKLWTINVKTMETHLISF